MERSVNDFSEYQITEEYFPGISDAIHDLHDYHLECYEDDNSSSYGNTKWLSPNFLKQATSNNIDNLVVGLGPFFDFVGGDAHHIRLDSLDSTERRFSNLESLMGKDELNRCSPKKYYIEDLITPADTFKSMSLAEEEGSNVFYPDTVSSYIDDSEIGWGEEWYESTRDPMIEDLERFFSELELEREQYPETDHNELLLQNAEDLEGETAVITYSEEVLDKSQEYGRELITQQPKLTWQIIQ